MKGAALKTCLFLSALFLLVYGSCNWITAHRDDVGTWVYAWERYIPFVPIFIIPYMSIDLFFVAAPFLCSDRMELSLLSRRITLAILVSGAFFLIMPLTLSVQRPHVEGWLGVIYNNFCKMDQPYNLFPSMHLALRTILAELYGRHTRGLLRWASHIWFSLIGLSTLLVYQHHFADVVGGFALAAVCFYLVRRVPLRLPVERNHRALLYYTLGCAALTALAFVARPWSMILLWPALSLAIAALGYLGFGPAIFRKENGRLPFSTRLVLAPLLIGQWLSFCHYARRSAAWNQVTSRVWIGRRLSDSESRALLEQGVTAVLDLTGEFSMSRGFATIQYLNVQVLDLTAPTLEQLRESVRFIEAVTQTGAVYIHCKAGYSRSAAVVGAYLLATGLAADTRQAIDMIRKARPSVIIRPEVEVCLERFASHKSCRMT